MTSVLELMSNKLSLTGRMALHPGKDTQKKVSDYVNRLKACHFSSVKMVDLFGKINQRPKGKHVNFGRKLSWNAERKVNEERKYIEINFTRSHDVSF